MFETAITDGAKKLRLQEEVAKAGRMDAHIAALLVDVVPGGKFAFLAVGGGGRGLVSVKLLVGVVDEIFLSRHFDDEPGRTKVWCGRWLASGGVCGKRRKVNRGRGARPQKVGMQKSRGLVPKSKMS